MPDTPAQPLNIQLAHSTLPDGTPLCHLAFTQGGLSQTATLSPDDMDRLAEQMAATARRARTGLIVPAPKVPPLNGLRAEERVS